MTTIYFFWPHFLHVCNTLPSFLVVAVFTTLPEYTCAHFPVTVTVYDAERDPTVAVIFTVPFLRPVTTPVDDTFAIAEFDVFHLAPASTLYDVLPYCPRTALSVRVIFCPSCTFLFPVILTDVILSFCTSTVTSLSPVDLAIVST